MTAGSFCQNCGTAMAEANFCPTCGLAQTAHAEMTRAQAQVVAHLAQRHPVPALLSFFLPGIGQLIKGQIATMLLVWVLLAVTGFIAVVTGIGVILVFLVWGWQLHDAYKSPETSE